MNRSCTLVAACTAMLFFGASLSRTQPQLPLPQASPKADLSQTIGATEVHVNYHRPGVKGREIWGKLVPYGEVWRAGANENTTISFSDPVKIGGKDLPAGTYGLHMIPTQADWTVIFSRNATSWGSYFYRESEDALRITVKPQPSDYREWLQYAFSDLSDTSAVLSLSWEKLRVPIPITVDTRSVIVAYARDAFLRGAAGFTWPGFNAAAQYCLRNNIHLSEALAWVDTSIALNENFTNLRTKAAILEKMGKTDGANLLRDRSQRFATEADLNNLGYTYLADNKIKDAIGVFEKNVKAHPDSWNVYDSLGEALEKSGDTKGAIANYEKALSMVNDGVNKKRLTDILTRLKAK